MTSQYYLSVLISQHCGQTYRYGSTRIPFNKYAQLFWTYVNQTVGLIHSACWKLLIFLSKMGVPIKKPCSFFNKKPLFRITNLPRVLLRRGLKFALCFIVGVPILYLVSTCSCVSLWSFVSYQKTLAIFLALQDSTPQKDCNGLHLAFAMHVSGLQPI